MGRFIVKGSVTSTLTLRDVVQVLNKFYVQYVPKYIYAKYATCKYRAGLETNIENDNYCW